MRKIILQVAVSLDMYIEGPNGEYDWCFDANDVGMKEFLQGIDTILYGRKSWELMVREAEAMGPNPFGKKENIVVSNTLTEVAGAKLISGDIAAEIARLKSGSGKNIWLFGGASLTASLMNARLVDELQLAVHPIVLGSGKPLFQGIDGRVKTSLADCKTYDFDLVMLTYTVVK